MCSAAQSCLSLCNPTDCSLPGSSCPWNFPGKNAGAKSLQLCLTLYDPMDWLQPTRLLCPWDSPGKETGMGCHFLLQGIFHGRILEWAIISLIAGTFPTQRSNLSLLCLMHWKTGSLLMRHLGSQILLYNHVQLIMCLKYTFYVIMGLIIQYLRHKKPTIYLLPSS